MIYLTTQLWGNQSIKGQWWVLQPVKKEKCLSDTYKSASKIMQMSKIIPKYENLMQDTDHVNKPPKN